VEVAGTEAFVLSFLRALEGFEVLEVARSGAVAIERANGASIPLTFTSEAV
jgi:acetolactate synthase small subunit